MASSLYGPLESQLAQSSISPLNQGLGPNDATSPVASRPSSRRSLARTPATEALPTDHSPPPHRPRSVQQVQNMAQAHHNNVVVLRPIPVPDKYPDLNFKPLMLQTKSLVALLIFNILCLVGIVLVVYKADSHSQFHSAYSNIHLVVRYVPTIVGTLTVLFFRSMRNTLSRIQPYISMASSGDGGSRGSKTLGLIYTPGIYWGRSLRLHHRHQDWLRWAMFLGSYGTIQITGYKAALFTASSAPDGTWVLTVHNPMAYVLMSLYGVDIILIVMTLIKMLVNKTGLKWDPVTIADLLALFHGSNALEEFRTLEQLHQRTAFDLLAEKCFRLGYWERVDGRKTTIWYGIGKVTTLQAAVERDVEDASTPESTLPNCPECSNDHHTTFCTNYDEPYSTIYPWRKNNLFFPWTVFFWAVPVFASLCICIYAASSSRVNKGFTIHNTWWKVRPASVNSTSIIPANVTSPAGDLLLELSSLNFNAANDLVLYVFVFRSLLVILATSFAVAWFSSVDQSTRFSQPFANMYNKNACSTDSILLDYMWGFPGQVTFNAFTNSHYKVAWFSLLDLASPIFPILVGGLFTITNTGELIVFTIVPVTFYFVLAYLTIYLFTLPFILPCRNRDRRLLRFHGAIGDYVSLFYASHLLNDSDAENPESDTLNISEENVTKRHLESRIFLEEKTYTTGFYTGTDGKRHWGLERPDLSDVKFFTREAFQTERKQMLAAREAAEAEKIAAQERGRNGQS